VRASVHVLACTACRHREEAKPTKTCACESTNFSRFLPPKSIPIIFLLLYRCRNTPPVVHRILLIKAIGQYFKGPTTWRWPHVGKSSQNASAEPGDGEINAQLQVRRWRAASKWAAAVAGTSVLAFAFAFACDARGRERDATLSQEDLRFVCFGWRATWPRLDGSAWRRVSRDPKSVHRLVGWMSTLRWKIGPL
jgi:hypothetical protein